MLPDQLVYAMEVTLNGLMAGVMYALVALGFVLIFKASGIFNYAQGVLALFAALTLVGLQNGQIPFAHLINAALGTNLHSFGWTLPAALAIALTALVMVGLAWAIERLILKHLVNQEPIILFMATIGLAYFLEGLGDVMWGADIKMLDVGLPQGISEGIEAVTAEWFGYGFFIDRLDIVATLVAAALVAALTLFSQYTKYGRALRAVADDHQAALSVGISLRFVWVLVWSIAGFVALIAGIMWGAKSGVQFSLSLIALKALPVPHARRLHLDPRRHRGRAHHRHGREAVRVLCGPPDRRRDRELVRLCARTPVPRLPAAGPVRRTHHREGLIHAFTVKRASSRRATRRTARPSRSGGTGSGIRWRWSWASPSCPSSSTTTGPMPWSCPS